MELKRCSKCREERQITKFSKNRSTNDGLSSQCKDCCKDYKDAKREKKLLQPESLEDYQLAFEEYCNDEEINYVK